MPQFEVFDFERNISGSSASASNESRSSVNLNEGWNEREASPLAGHGDKSRLARALMAML